jgi:hypothetical protein
MKMMKKSFWDLVSTRKRWRFVSVSVPFTCLFDLNTGFSRQLLPWLDSWYKSHVTVLINNYISQSFVLCPCDSILWLTHLFACIFDDILKSQIDSWLKSSIRLNQRKSQYLHSYASFKSEEKECEQSKLVS